VRLGCVSFVNAYGIYLFVKKFMPNPEARLTRAILHYLNEQLSTKAIRLNQDQAQSGNPDIFGVHAGQAFLMEVKAPKGVLSKLQIVKVEEWSRSGAYVSVVRSLEEAKLEFNAIKHIMIGEDYG